MDDNETLSNLRRWDKIMDREVAKAHAEQKEGMEIVEKNGVIALAGDVDGQDDEWVVMDECPDEYECDR